VVQAAYRAFARAAIIATVISIARLRGLFSMTLECWFCNVCQTMRLIKEKDRCIRDPQPENCPLRPLPKLG
jgi:hypothetical protein